MIHGKAENEYEVLAAAPQIEGYRLMRVRGKDDAVCYVCDDVELSMEDIVSARASKSLFNEGFYEVSAKLTPEGRGRLARLTRDYQPHGAKNSSDLGRALAIVVNPTFQEIYPLKKSSSPNLV